MVMAGDPARQVSAIRNWPTILVANPLFRDFGACFGCAVRAAHEILGGMSGVVLAARLSPRLGDLEDARRWACAARALGEASPGAAAIATRIEALVAEAGSHGYGSTEFEAATCGCGSIGRASEPKADSSGVRPTVASAGRARRPREGRLNLFDRLKETFGRGPRMCPSAE